MLLFNPRPQVREDDGLSQLVCPKCWLKLCMFQEFRESCIVNDRTLRLQLTCSTYWGDDDDDDNFDEKPLIDDLDDMMATGDDNNEPADAHPDAAVLCDTCGKQFSKRWELREHRKRSEQCRASRTF